MGEHTKKIETLKRMLCDGEPITGKMLEFALEQVPTPQPNWGKSEEIWIGIGDKIRRGERLGDYELHLMVDVILLHARLGAETQEREVLREHFSNHNC
jgi:hypothetical protein